MQGSVSIFPIYGVPDINVGDNLAIIIGDCLEKSFNEVIDGDIICIAHKIFSKAEGNIYDLKDVSPSEEAISFAKKLNKDPRKVEVILNQSTRVIRAFKREDQNEGVMICEHRLGFISANAAVDESNVSGTEKVITLPDNPDLSSRNLQIELQNRFKVRLGVVMTDTFGRPWRLGQVNVAVGLAGVPATKKEQGNLDAWGKELFVTEPAFADEISAASGLVIKKASKTPIVLFRGLEWNHHDSHGSDLLRKQEEDMFR
jgi:coenzyme F420-0:L-glutamate ligase/coenzyme F420-1:gamma-L-glutamate ligase